MNQTKHSYSIKDANLYTKLVCVTLKLLMCNFLSSLQFPGVRAHTVGFWGPFPF